MYAHDQCDDQHREQAELHHRVIKGLIAFFDHFRQFRREHEDSSGHRNEADNQERSRLQNMLAKRYLNRIENLDEDNNKQNPIEELHNMF